MFEVELKFAVADPLPIQAALTALGASPGTALVQVDRYFNHPSRDLAQTDEAFRIRTVGDQNFVTYKGPVLDRQTKTRRELETRFEDGAAAFARMVETLTSLGFHPVRDVRKARVPWELELSGRHFEIAVDAVDELGTFIEIETLTHDEGRDSARDAVLELAARLGLTQAERRSYLRLLKDRDESRMTPSAE